MHVFVTGATGWVGSVVVRELLDAGHRVSGLARSADKANALAATGAEVVRGTLEQQQVLTRAADSADAVVHTAFNHDFSRFAENARQDQDIIQLFGDVLAGSQRPLLVTSGLAALASGRLATEADVPAAHPGMPRRSEQAARELAARGIRAATVRLPPSVHGIGDHGFIPILIRLAREKGVSAYVGEGRNRWAGVHRLDAGRVYRLALEQGVTEAAYHALDDEGVFFKDIAEVIGRRLGVPVESRGPEHFGWFGGFAAADMCASSLRTRQLLDWQPRQAGLLQDLDQAGYFEA
jgi:nucleoside-diphosphate-sugar epimerase